MSRQRPVTRSSIGCAPSNTTTSLETRSFPLRSYPARLTSATLEHVGPDPTPVQKSLIERASWLELKLALLDAKIARQCDSEYDSATYLSWVGHLRRLYQTLGIGRPAPKFADLMKSPPKPRKTEAA